MWEVQCKWPSGLINGLLTANAGLTVNGAVVINSTVNANGSIGSSGQVLTSQGGPAYWAPPGLLSATLTLTDANIQAWITSNTPLVLVTAQGANTTILVAYIVAHVVLHPNEFAFAAPINFYYAQGTGSGNTTPTTLTLCQQLSFSVGGGFSVDQTFMFIGENGSNAFGGTGDPPDPTLIPTDKNVLIKLGTGMESITPNTGYIVIQAYYLVVSDLM